jgi:hypothetical protein
MRDDVTMRSTDSTSAPLATYASPRLIVYGSLGQITQKVGNKSNMDGGFINGMKNSQ